MAGDACGMMMALSWRALALGAHLGFPQHFSFLLSLFGSGLGYIFFFFFFLYMYLSIHISAVAQGFNKTGKVDA